MNNVGYLSANKNNDECYTPHYAVHPLIKYINPNNIVWCPFDEPWSAFVNGNRVICSHINKGLNFFNYEPPVYDIIISNPPFSIKDAVLERLYSLNKPFAILLPMNSLQGVKRFQYFKNGIQLLAFDQRIGFHNDINSISPVEGSPFASAYFCKDLLPRDLIVEHLNKYNEPLKPIAIKLIDNSKKRMVCNIKK